VDIPLTTARLFDGLRDASVAVAPLATWDEHTRELDESAWQRLEILTRLLRESASRDRIHQLLAASNERALKVFPGFCRRDAQLLTLELLLKSPFRIEELARKWIAALGGTITGETVKESTARLERIDFGGVLKNLAAADKDREERMKKLKELEEKRLREQQEAYQRAGRE